MWACTTPSTEDNSKRVIIMKRHMWRSQEQDDLKTAFSSNGCSLESLQGSSHPIHSVNGLGEQHWVTASFSSRNSELPLEEAVGFAAELTWLNKTGLAGLFHIVKSWTKDIIFLFLTTPNSLFIEMTITHRQCNSRPFQCLYLHMIHTFTWQRHGTRHVFSFSHHNSWQDPAKKTLELITKCDYDRII